MNNKDLQFSKYIDIDSTYRDRERYPNPSNFEISSGPSADNTSLVSNQVQQYPPISATGESNLRLQPISFYNDRENATVVSTEYNGFMYDFNSQGTQLLLDPVVLKSISPSNPNAVQTSNDYPLGYIPLPRNNNFYINRQIRDSASGEYRKIISSNYYNEELFLQTVTITHITSSNGVSKVILDPNDTIIPSDIDRYYVGKSIVIDGINYLIKDYYINSARTPIIEINNTLPYASYTLPITVDIVANEYWVIEILTPFSNDISKYPTYTNDTVQNVYSINQIAENSEDIIALDLTRSPDGILYTFYSTNDQVSYVQSTDATGVSWGDVNVVLAKTDVSSNLTHGISANFFDFSEAGAYKYVSVAYTIRNYLISSVYIRPILLLTFNNGLVKDETINDIQMIENSGVVLDTDETFPRNKCANFDGSSYLNLYKNGNLKFYFIDNTALTIAFWFKTSASGKVINLNTPQGRLAIDIELGECRVFMYDRSTILLQVATGGGGSNAYNDGSWRHFAFAIGPTGNKIYINGADQAADLTYTSGTTAGSSDVISLITQISIGSYALADDTNDTIASPKYTGLLDNVFISTHQYTTSEILSLYQFTTVSNEVSSGISGDSIVVSSQIVPNALPFSNAALLLEFEDATDIPLDTSSTNATITNTGVTVSTADPNPSSDTVAVFDGNSYLHVLNDIDLNTALSSLVDFTASFWFKAPTHTSPFDGTNFNKSLLFTFYGNAVRNIGQENIQDSDVTPSNITFDSDASRKEFAVFDSSTSSWIQIADWYGDPQFLTVSLWFKPTAGGDSGIIYLENGTTYFEINFTSARKIQVVFVDSGTTELDFLSDTVFTLDTWYQITFHMDLISYAGIIVNNGLFVNGVLDPVVYSTGSSAYSTGVMVFETIEIGRNRSVEYFDGALDSIYIASNPYLRYTASVNDFETLYTNTIVDSNPGDVLLCVRDTVSEIELTIELIYRRIYVQMINYSGIGPTSTLFRFASSNYDLASTSNTIVYDDIFTNAWNHVTLTTGALGNQLYVNGFLYENVEYFTGSSSSTDIPTNINQVSIGANVTSFGVQQHVTGAIDLVYLSKIRPTSSNDFISLTGFTPSVFFTTLVRGDALAGGGDFVSNVGGRVKLLQQPSNYNAASIDHRDFKGYPMIVYTIDTGELGVSFSQDTLPISFQSGAIDTEYTFYNGTSSPVSFLMDASNSIASNNSIPDNGDFITNTGATYALHIDATTKYLYLTAYTNAATARVIQITSTPVDAALFINTLIDLSDGLITNASGPINLPQIGYRIGDDLYISKINCSRFSAVRDILLNQVASSIFLKGGISTATGVHIIDPSSRNSYQVEEQLFENYNINVIRNDQVIRYITDSGSLNNSNSDVIAQTTSRDTIIDSVISNDYEDIFSVYTNSQIRLLAQSPLAQTFFESVPYSISGEAVNVASGSDIVSYNAATRKLVLPDIPSVSRSDNVYNNTYFHIYSIPTNPLPSNPIIFNDYILITHYDSSTRTITLSSALTHDVSLYGSNLLGDNQYGWSILTNTTNLVRNINFTGTISTMTQPTCYRIRLHSLTLPNVTLSSGGGDRIAFYPYVFVGFKILNNQHVNVLYSNNPNASESMFKVPITNLVSPQSATFVNLSGGGMTHILTLVPYASFTFSVFLPNGELFTTLESDTRSPSAANPDLQVSAVFEITRLPC